MPYSCKIPLVDSLFSSGIRDCFPSFNNESTFFYPLPPFSGVLPRESFNNDLEHKIGRMTPDKKSNLERKLKDVDDEEARALRLYTTGKISDKVWDNMWGARKTCQ